MFELIFFGTSASAPSTWRGLPSQMVKHDEYRFLVDCGEGTQRQILTSGVGFKQLTRILITHSHLDHILGIAGLISTFARWEACEQMEIFGGRAALERIHTLIYGVVLRGEASPMPIQYRPITAGQFFEADDFTISAFPVRHRGPDCFGYIFEEKGRRPFLPEKAEALNIPPGPWRRDLVEGRSITLPDGRTIEPDMVLGELRRGTRLVLTGDVGETQNLVEPCRNADALVCEATYLQEEAEMAHQYGHITARDAADLAQKAAVGKLIMTHISRRYRERDVLAEAQATFANCSVARDMDIYHISQDKTERIKAEEQ